MCCRIPGLSAAPTSKRALGGIKRLPRKGESFLALAGGVAWQPAMAGSLHPPFSLLRKERMRRARWKRENGGAQGVLPPSTHVFGPRRGASGGFGGRCMDCPSVLAAANLVVGEEMLLWGGPWVPTAPRTALPNSLGLPQSGPPASRRFPNLADLLLVRIFDSAIPQYQLLPQLAPAFHIAPSEAPVFVLSMKFPYILYAPPLTQQKVSVILQPETQKVSVKGWEKLCLTS